MKVVVVAGAEAGILWLAATIDTGRRYRLNCFRAIRVAASLALFVHLASHIKPLAMQREQLGIYRMSVADPMVI